ncbi:hypothetical protein C8R44DRAFT_877264 [Mycena epipterygia]|nr:hypothetical protein C8R44DRAFT_877264 [Mycena epipterygia]
MLAHEGRDSESNGSSLEAMFLFVGAIFVALGSSYTFDWFLGAFGPIIDGASDVYYTYQEEKESTLSTKRRFAGKDSSTSKRIRLAHSDLKVTHFTKVKAVFGNLDTTPGTSPFINTTLPRILDQIDILSIFKQPPADTPPIAANTIHPSLVPRFSFSDLRGQARVVIAGIAAFSRREVAAFQAAAFPEGTSIIPHLPQAFYQGFMSALMVDPGNIPLPTTPSSPVDAPERRFPLTYRRSRAPSLPSPRLRKSASTSNLPAAKPGLRRHFLTSSTLRTPHSLKSWYPHHKLNFIPTSERLQEPSLTTHSVAAASTLPHRYYGPF